jgi:hypothetical protein
MLICMFLDIYLCYSVPNAPYKTFTKLALQLRTRHSVTPGTEDVYQIGKVGIT